MRNLGLPLFALMLAQAGCAGTDSVADGRLMRINWVDSRITLDTGETFEVPDRYRLNRLESGDLVAVSYYVEDGRRIATWIWGPHRFP